MGFVAGKRTIIDSTANINVVHNVPGGGFSGYASTSLNQRIHTLDNPNPNAFGTGDVFGYSAAISGNRCVVGAYQETDAGGSGSGKIYIFDIINGTLMHIIDNPNVFLDSAGDNFGYSVAISGNRCIVGALNEDEFVQGSAGKAYIFNTITGQRLTILNNPNDYGFSSNDQFGSTVAIYKNICAVAAINEDDAAYNNSGRVYIFNTESGQRLYTLANPTPASASAFGFSLAMFDDILVVGEYGSSNGGRVHLYNTSTGAFIRTINNPNVYDTGIGDFFGYSVGIYEDKIIVGAPFEDAVIGTQVGRAYLYDINGNLLFTLNELNNAGQRFGSSVGISKNRCVVGAPYDSANGSGSGRTYVFDTTTGNRLHILSNPNAYDTVVNDNFGFTVGISGNYLISTAPNEDDVTGTSSGKAYIFGANGSIDSLSRITQSLYI